MSSTSDTSSWDTNTSYVGYDGNYINKYGKERYIALSNGFNNNYDPGKGYNYSHQKPIDT